MAFGGCEGVGPAEGIVRCDACGTWSHVLCGGVSIGAKASEALFVASATGYVVDTEPAGSIGDTTSVKPVPDARVMKEEHLCRGCARVTDGSGSDLSPRIASVLSEGRDTRLQMLSILDKDVAAGCPHGVFDINVRRPLLFPR